MSGCDFVRDRLELLADGALAADDAAAVRAHLAACAACRAYESESAFLVAPLAGFPPGPYLPPPAPTPGGGRPPWLLGLSLLAAVLGAAGAGVALFRGQGDAPAVPAATDRRTAVGDGPGARATPSGEGTDAGASDGGARRGAAVADPEGEDSDPPPPPDPLGGSLVGRVLRWPDGTPVAGASVRVGPHTTVTDGAGVFRATGLPRHVAIRVRIEAAGFPALDALAPEIPVGRLAVLEDIPVGPAAAARVLVRDGSGAPLPGATVVARRYLVTAGAFDGADYTTGPGARAAPAIATAVADAAGVAILDGLPPGDVHVEARAPGFARSPPVRLPVTLPSPAAAAGTAFEVTLHRGRSLRGTVRDAATGAPAAGAEVVAAPLPRLPSLGDARCPLGATTDGAGRFVLEDVPAEPVLVRARIAGTARIAAILVDPTSVAEVPLVVPAGRPVRARAHRPDGAPPGAPVALRLAVAARPCPVPLIVPLATDAAGDLVGPEVVTDDPHVVDAAGAAAAPGSSAPWRGGPPARIVTDVVPTARWEAVVLDPAGAPAGGAAVLLFLAHGDGVGGWVDARADAAGRVSVDGLPEGKAYALAWSEWATTPWSAAPEAIERALAGGDDDAFAPGIVAIGRDAPVATLRLVAAPAVHGTVTDASGAPRRARVRRFPAPGAAPTPATAWSAPDGTFRLAPALPGQPVAGVLAEDGLVAAWIPTPGVRGAADGTLRVVLPDAPTVLRGRVTGPGGAVPSGLRLKVAASSDGGLSPVHAGAPVPVGADGSFAFSADAALLRRTTALPPTHLRLVATADDHEPRQVVIPAGAGDPVLMVLEPRVAVEGVVVDATGAPRPGALVGWPHAIHAATVRLPLHAATAGPDGSFRMTVPADVPGRHAIIALAADGSRAAALAPEPGAGPHRAVLHSTRPLTVRVADAAGAPVAGALVAWNGGPAWADAGRTESSEDGRAVLSAVPDVPGTITITPPAPPTAGAPSLAPCRVSLDPPLPSEVTVTLERTAVLHGTVRWHDGALADGVRIAVRRPGGEIAARTLAGPDGAFAVRVAPGPWRVEAEAEGSGTAAALDAVEVPGDAVEILLPPPPPTRTVDAVVRDADGQPVPGALVVAQPATGPRITARADAVGAVRLAIPAGVDVDLAVVGKDGAATHFRVGAEGPPPAVLPARATGATGLRGVVLRPDGGPAAGVPVRAWHRGATRAGDAGADGIPLAPGFRATVTDAEGRFHLGDPEGEWDVRAGAPFGATVGGGAARSAAPHDEPLALAVRAGVSMSVRVLDADGRVRAAARLRARVSGPPGSSHPADSLPVTTDGSGVAVIPGLPPGRLHLTEEDPGSPPTRVWVVDIPADGGGGVVDLRPVP